MAFASTVGGLIGSLGVSVLGMPGGFVRPALLCAFAAVGLAVSLRRTGAAGAI